MQGQSTAELPADVAVLRAERDAARRALAQVHTERELFIANLSHELRTPLTAILGYTDLLALEIAKSINPRKAQYLGALRAAGGHLVEVLDAVLNVSRLRAGAMTLKEEQISIPDVANTAIQLVSSLATDRSIEIVARHAPGIALVMADAQLMRQIIANLLSNAIKVSPVGGKIIVSTTLRANDQVRIVVRDYGPGMEAATIERVMRPFAQAVQAQGFGAAGTGLGLALVRSMVELHDGNFQLVSHVGHGTRAIVTLPAARLCAPLKLGDQSEFTFVRSGTQPI